MKLTLEGMDEDRKKKASADCDISYIMEAIWRRFNDMEIGERFVLKKGLMEFAFPSTTSMVPPLSKVKTKGAPKKRKQYDVKRDPSFFEHVDEAVKTDIQSSVKKSSQRSSKQHDMHLMNWIPPHMHDYIDDIINVQGDGNCGYRCIAAALGRGDESWPLVRQELIQEINGHIVLYEQLFGDNLQSIRDSLFVTDLGPQSVEKWMTMPDMGYVIATKYQIIVVAFH